MNDKYKHKPQKKHTLSEVLKSLQDLIRTDLISAQQQATASLDAAPAEHTPAPAAPTEADSFNQALDQLDEIITHKIIEPVERARSTPPEPLLPDEVIEIDWDEAFGGDTAATKSSEASPDTPAAPADSSPEETIELQPITIESIAPEPVDTPAPPPEVATTHEPVAPPNASSVAKNPSPPTIETVAAREQPKTPPVEIQSPRADESTKAPAGPQHELFETVALAPTEAPTSDDDASATLESIELEPMASTDISSAETEPTVPVATNDTADIPTVVIEYEGGEPEATTIELTAADPPPEEPKVAAPPLSLADEDPKPKEPPRAAPAAPKPASTSAPKKPLELAPDTSPAAPEVKPATPKKTAAPRPATTATKPKAAEPKTPVQEEIPVLKEIAPVGAPPSAPLPSASHARDIAIRVIAKLNIERRKAGEPPLDIKTIERLQLHLTDALSKREITKSK